jgi:hypothetical protein
LVNWILSGGIVTKDEALKLLEDAAGVARQHGATDHEVRYATGLQPPYAMPGLTVEGQKGAQFGPVTEDSGRGSERPETPAAVIDINKGKRKPK